MPMVKLVPQVLDLMDKFYDEPSKWCQGKHYIYDIDGNVMCCCLAAAAQMCSEEVPDLTRSVRVDLYVATLIELKKVHGTVIKYNDEPSTTFSDIKQTIKTARAAVV